VPRASNRGKRSSRNAGLPAALLDPRCYGRGVKKVRLVETHVSWVFLTGRYAYKVKKPVKLPFVDFSTLALRKRFCEEEVRVNRRLAPELYLGVVPIGGTPAAPRVDRSPAFEYAVKMHEFPASARLDRRLAQDRVPRTAAAEFGARLAQFHGGLPPLHGIATEETATTALRNVEELAALTKPDHKADIDFLREWTKRRCASLAAVFAWRAAGGAYRECHGDLHLQNLLWQAGKITAFDALEFDRKLRDIDVVSETAFLAMDLRAHGRRDLSYEFLNRYLEVGGDYAGVDVLPFYLVYRALVRAKVAAIKRAQAGGAEEPEYDRYLATALELAAPKKPLLVIAHGLSGSGKSHVAAELVGQLPAIRVRSDVERKRLHGIAPLAHTNSGIGRGIYTAEATRRTYSALAKIADTLLRNGENALVDAAFLTRRERLEFRQVAAANAARFAILSCRASRAELERRIRVRARGGRDASEADLAVLGHQLRTEEPLDAAERRHAVTVDTEQPIRYAELAARLHEM
jgi:hypothetical protein